jgi:Uma2 family endonuclease
MTTAFSHVWPWAEEEYLALGETSDRVELFDGSLYVTPAPTPQHQMISSELYVALRPGARQVGLYVVEGPNVRLRPGRIPIPDLIIAEGIDPLVPVVPADAVRFVCEIVSPSNASADKVLKMHYYAAAGIPWYLLVEHDTATLHLYRLDGDKYREHTIVEVGGTLRLTEPVVAEIDPAVLLPRR